MTENNKIFERVNDVIYSREAGSTTRTKISQVSAVDLQRIREDKLWGEIRQAAKTNNALQAALDHAIMIYKLSKEYNDGI
jgi:hypothetical protein